MKNTEQVVKNILQTTNKSNQITYDIIEGIDNRLSERGTITPKQGLWLLNRIFRDDMHIPGDFLSKIENGGIAEQQEAYAKIKNALENGEMPTTSVEPKPAVAETPKKDPQTVIDDLRDKLVRERELKEKYKVDNIDPKTVVIESALRMLLGDGWDLPKELVKKYIS